MQIQKLNLRDFRNISALQLNPHPNINVIYGDNAQGKTNIIEAIWLFTGGRSFRGASAQSLLKSGCDRARLELAYLGGGRDNEAALQYGEGKGVWLNGVSVTGACALMGSFKAVVFSPVHLSIIKDGPELRRSFLDTGICQLKPRYISVLREYRQILLQRNALLKSGTRSSLITPQLDVFDTQLARSAAIIAKTRYTYLQRIAKKAESYYRQMATMGDQISLSYLCSVPEAGGFDKEVFAEAFYSQRSKDIEARTTTIGVHRDDFSAEVGGFPARSHGSQGQQRSIVLALKLAEAEIFYEESGEYPVVLLDDVMSELDESRRKFLLSQLTAPQVFITCCEPSAIIGVEKESLFKIREGQIIS